MKYPIKKAGLSVLLILCVNAAAFAVNPIKELLEDANSRGEFSGVLLISREGKAEYKAAVGFANREWKINNTIETKFRISSVTKQFTALLVMQLVESGKIKLDDPVTNYLPEFRKDTFSRVTVRSLLQSSSGLPLLENEEFYTGRRPELTNYQFVIKKYLGGDLISVPGERFNYNNGDFIVAGAIIEKVTGKTYETVLNEKVLVPLKMNDTGLIKNGRIVEKLARGYTFDQGVYSFESFQNIENYGPAGAMYSTAEDLAKWNQALIGNKLLAAKTTEEMFTPSDKLGYVALGSWVYQFEGTMQSYRFVERQGGIGGFCSLNIVVPSEGISLIFLSNVQSSVLFQTYTGKGLSADIFNLFKTPPDSV